VSALVLETMQHEAAAMFADFSIEQLDDGLPVVRGPDSA